MTTESATPEGVASSEGLGLETERAAFETWAAPMLGDNPTWRGSAPCELAWQAWKAANARAFAAGADAGVAAERARCAALCAARFDALNAKNRGHHSDYENGAIDAWDMAERGILEA
jgi:hypothetical protein